MELCINADDCSLCVVDGYNHRVQLILLPELQMLKNKEAISSRMKRKTTEVSNIVRPSKISLQAEISLLRFNSSKYLTSYNITSRNGTNKNDVDNSNIEMDRIYLLFPPLGLYLTVANHDVQHLLKAGFFLQDIKTEIRNIPHSKKIETCNMQSFSSTFRDDNTLLSDSMSRSNKSSTIAAEFHNTRDFYSKDESVKTKSIKKLNNQAKIFMDLIIDVVNDSNSENNDEDYSNKSLLNDNVTHTSIECKNNHEILDQSNTSDSLNIQTIDFNLIVPSVFAMHALLERSWHPDKYLPHTVIKALVHLMCQDDVETENIKTYERKRILAACSALLTAIVKVGTRSSEIVFTTLLSELKLFEIKSIKSNLDLTNSTWGDSKIESRIHPEVYVAPKEILDDEIIVSAQGSDRNSRADSTKGKKDEGNNNGENRSNDMHDDDDDDDDDDEVVMSLRLLAILLLNMCNSNYRFPFPYHSISPVVEEEDLRVGTDSAAAAASRESISTTNNDHVKQEHLSTLNVNPLNYNDKNSESSKYDSYDKDIQVLVVRQCYMNKRKYASRASNTSTSSNWEGRSVLGQEMKYSSISANTTDHSVQSSPNRLKDNNHSLRERSHSISRGRNLSSPMNTEFLNLLDCVYKINKSRQPTTRNDENDLMTDYKNKDLSATEINTEIAAGHSISFYQIQLDLLVTANKCFSQVIIILFVLHLSIHELRLCYNGIHLQTEHFI